jgi:hypothetical protein
MKSFQDRLKTHRKVSCINHNLGQIDLAQKSPDTNLLNDLFQVCAPSANWRRIIDKILDEYMPAEMKESHAYYVRGDTLVTLLKVLHCYLGNIMLRAKSTVAPRQSPPIVHGAHLIA